MSTKDSAPKPRPSVRWWPAAVILVLGAGGISWTLLRTTANFQGQVLAALALGILTVLLLVLWLLLASRLPWRRRLAIFAALVVFGGVFGLLFEIEGVTGDFVPILNWRFGGEPVLGELAGRAQTTPTPWDSPQFLGPERSGEFPDAGLATDWEKDPPRELWRREVGEAWSSFAVVGQTAVTLEQREGSEWVMAYDLLTGEPLWTHAIPESYDSVVAGSGPRSTPSVRNGVVYSYGATGVLRALDLEDGELLWRRDVVETHGSGLPEWGHASSPLVTPDGLVVVVAGDRDGRENQLFVAYDAETGEKVWAGGSDKAAYASPSLVEIAGVPQVVTFGQKYLTAVDPATGETLWQAEFREGQPNVAQPMVIGMNRLLASAGYGIGSKLYEIEPPAGDGDGDGDAWQVEKLWDSPRLKAKFANFVLHDGVVYGLDDGVLVAMDPETGERLWKRGRYGHGQLLLVGDSLLVQTEDGELVLVEATPEEHRELAKLQALSGKSWNPPALAGRYLLVRNHREAVAYELPLVAPSSSQQ